MNEPTNPQTNDERLMKTLADGLDAMSDHEIAGHLEEAARTVLAYVGEPDHDRLVSGMLWAAGAARIRKAIIRAAEDAKLIADLTEKIDVDEHLGGMAP